MPQFSLYEQALQDGLDKLKKYYAKFDDKPNYVLALGENHSGFNLSCTHYFIVLHPYYKLNYIKMAWGGLKEQQEEIAAGNPFAKNWQEEAHETVRKAVSTSIYFVL